MSARPHVLFVSTGTSCRSKIEEGLARDMSGGGHRDLLDDCQRVCDEIRSLAMDLPEAPDIAVTKEVEDE